jgi:two-component sensor histidine kinase
VGPVITWRVTGRLREREAALRLQDVVFRIALEAAPTGLVVLGATATIELVNAHVEALFGLTRAQLTGGPVSQLLPKGLVPGEQAAKSQRGAELVVEVGVTPLLTPHGPATLCSIVDVTERRLATARLERSVHEKETLLREVHHRVKNNLQVISSLLSVQASFATDQPSRALLEASCARVYSISLVHEMLYQAADLNLGQVSLDAYLRTLVEHLVQALEIDESAPQVSVDASGVTLPIDRAIPLGLVVNELVTNSMKHAFEPGEQGHVTVRLQPSGDRHLALEVTDDGRGLGVSDGARPTMGLKLVATLARQLNGEVTTSATSPRGTTTQLRFEVQQ